MRTALKREYTAKMKKVELKDKQMDFVQKQIELLSDLNEVVWYFDESSVHSWTTLRSTYMHKVDKFQTTIRTKGEWFTIFGAIGGHLNGDIQFTYEILNTTNKENTLWFF